MNHCNHWIIMLSFSFNPRESATSVLTLLVHYKSLIFYKKPLGSRTRHLFWHKHVWTETCFPPWKRKLATCFLSQWNHVKKFLPETKPICWTTSTQATYIWVCLTPKHGRFTMTSACQKTPQRLLVLPSHFNSLCFSLPRMLCCLWHHGSLFPLTYSWCYCLPRPGLSVLLKVTFDFIG